MEQKTTTDFAGLVPGIEYDFPEENWVEFKSIDGTRLQTYRHSVENPKAVAVLFHGLGDYSNLLAYFAHKIASKQVVVLAFDQKGFGKSEGKRYEIKNFQSVLRDSINYVNLVASHYPNLKVFLGGNSMGGAIATYLSVSVSVNVEGLMLLCPAFSEFPAVSWFRRKFLGVVKAIRPNMVLGGPRSECKNPHGNPYYEIEPFVKDFAITTRTTHSLIKGLKYMRSHLDLVKSPFVIVLGSRDKVIDVGLVKKFHSETKVEDKTLLLYEDIAHSLLAENEAEEYFKKVSDWVSERI